MKRAGSDLVLLDVNVLLALAWPQHEFNAVAHRRLADRGHWATCALTQLAFLRLSSSRAVIPEAVTVGDAAALLTRMVTDRRHRYLDPMPAPGELASLWAPLQGPGQVTDAYLLETARRHGARLASFDRRMQAFAAAGGLEIWAG